MSCWTEEGDALYSVCVAPVLLGVREARRLKSFLKSMHGFDSVCLLGDPENTFLAFFYTRKSALGGMEFFERRGGYDIGCNVCEWRVASDGEPEYVGVVETVERFK